MTGTTRTPIAPTTATTARAAALALIFLLVDSASAFAAEPGRGPRRTLPSQAHARDLGAPRMNVPSTLGPAGPPPLGAPGPPPLGAAGPPPLGAPGPAPFAASDGIVARHRPPRHHRQRRPAVPCCVDDPAGDVDAAPARATDPFD